DKVAELVHEAVGLVFARVLEDAGVYKRDTKGQKALLRFIDSLGLE
ncbi:UTP--hexose-1-phosphate uridylyltransferase, partial [Streptococcus suis]